ncbi:hypothetical protein [Phenylobacterium kunshanense]|uniref:DUF1508 domain-containing protein n=1 Tax=Phenylobacterium kunshanense TaxID=1445034 RepID=A0A328BNX5_9CAUL|nr:hypothetical protein [Phenylobacterium kunshanense]RAK69050.1 hypothetical protein DJ019_03310 [Phenylobacterium kunshanense]
MDEPLLPTPSGYRLSLAAAGQAWSWRLTTPEGTSLTGLAPDRTSARRSAAFAAFTAEALTRTRRRRF